MKSLIRLILLLSLVQSSFGVGNRVIKDLKELKALGFEFALRGDNSNDVTTLTVELPKEFDAGEDIGAKPFSGVSFMQAKEPTIEGPALIGAPASNFPLHTYESKNGGRRCQFKVIPANLNNSYLQVSYVRDSSGDWPMLVHIPVADLIKKINQQKP